jgi:signal peptidase I
MSDQSLLSNFTLILFLLLVVTGIIWFIDKFYLAKQRRAKADAALVAFDARVKQLSADGIRADASSRATIEADLLRRPAWIEYSGSFFPVIALVFCLRSFLYEPFKIPSSSMVPTLQIGDLILVNKFTYGVRLPIINKKIIDINDPQRGDVVVFKYPKDMSMDYIKRVVGVPGDKVEYKNKKLTINGQAVSYEPLPEYLYKEGENGLKYFEHWDEKLGDSSSHQILTDAAAPPFVNPWDYPNRENCTYNTEGFICTVPEGQYFMMGDNRDNSADSRYWGFVPDKNIVGKAFFVWMNLGDLSRIGSFK